MVKAVVGEDTRFKLAEDRLSQSGLTSQVGLVIGKLSSPLDRGFVFDLVPTPPNDASEPACSLLGTTREDNKKGSKSKSQSVDSSSLVVDKDWVAEHARQVIFNEIHYAEVSRMLVGGMKVIGIYVWISDTAFKNSTIMLCQTVKGVADAAPISETDMDERLLIHICYSPRRWTCRNCSLSSNITSSSLRPCDFKMGRVLASVRTFKCMHNFNLRLPIHHESANQTFIDTLRNGISVYRKELKDANAMIDGNLVLNDEPCSTDDLHEVELLLPFMKNTFVEACCQKDVVGVLVFSGSVCSFASLNAKEPISQAVADIKDDIIRSLQSRLDIICDAADEDQPPADDASIESSKEQSPGKPVLQLSLNSLRNTCCLPFPRRVFVPWLENTFICEYLQPSETLEVLKDHCVELMSMEAPTDASTILEPEVEATTLKTKSFWDVAIPFSSSRKLSLEKDNVVPTISESSEKAGKSTSINVIAAVFFLFLSVLVGFVLLRRS